MVGGTWALIRTACGCACPDSRLAIHAYKAMVDKRHEIWTAAMAVDHYMKIVCI